MLTLTIINHKANKKLKNVKHAGFDLTTPDSYFTILVEVFMSHTSAEKKYFTNCIDRTEYKIMVLKLASKCKFVRQ